MTRDRNDYRAMPTTELIEETRYATNPNWQELAIALAERLDEHQLKLDGYRYDITSERHGWDG